MIALLSLIAARAFSIRSALSLAIVSPCSILFSTRSSRSVPRLIPSIASDCSFLICSTLTRLYSSCCRVCSIPPLLFLLPNSHHAPQAIKRTAAKHAKIFLSILTAPDFQPNILEKIRIAAAMTAVAKTESSIKRTAAIPVKIFLSILTASLIYILYIENYPRKASATPITNDIPTAKIKSLMFFTSNYKNLQTHQKTSR